jgi:hypothetical protein
VKTYFALLFVVALSVYLAQKASGRASRFLLYFAAFASLVLVGGLRASSVGTDAGNYVRTFQSISSLSDVRSAFGEPGVPLLAWFGKLIYDNYVTLFTLVAAIVTMCYLYGIRELSVDRATSVFVLLTSGAFLFSYNGMRQGIAIALFFIAIPFIYHRKFWPFLVCIAVACFFHISAIMVLPVYFIVPRKNDFRYRAFIFGLVVVSVLFFSELVPLTGRLNARYLEYGTVGQLRHGLYYAASLVAIGLFFLYFKRHVLQHRPLYDFLLNLYLLGLAVAVVAVVRTTFVSGVMRMNEYFITSQILLWPIVFVNLQGSRHRDIFRFAFVMLFLVFYATYLSRFSNLVPYSFNPLVSSWLPKWF